MGSISFPYLVAWVMLGVAVFLSLADWLRIAVRSAR